MIEWGEVFSLGHPSEASQNHLTEFRPNFMSTVMNHTELKDCRSPSNTAHHRMKGRSLRGDTRKVAANSSTKQGGKKVLGVQVQAEKLVVEEAVVPQLLPRSPVEDLFAGRRYDYGAARGPTRSAA